MKREGCDLSDSTNYLTSSSFLRPPFFIFPTFFSRVETRLQLAVSDSWRRGSHSEVCLSGISDTCDSASPPVRTMVIISSDRSKVLARYTDQGLRRREPCCLPPAMVVWAGQGVGGRPESRTPHPLPCDALLEGSTVTSSTL